MKGLEICCLKLESQAWKLLMWVVIMLLVISVFAHVVASTSHLPLDFNPICLTLQVAFGGSFFFCLLQPSKSCKTNGIQIEQGYKFEDPKFNNEEHLEKCVKVWTPPSKRTRSIYIYSLVIWILLVKERHACVCESQLNKSWVLKQGKAKASHKASCAPCMGLIIYPIGALK